MGISNILHKEAVFREQQAENTERFVIRHNAVIELGLSCHFHDENKSVIKLNIGSLVA